MSICVNPCQPHCVKMNTLVCPSTFDRFVQPAFVIPPYPLTNAPFMAEKYKEWVDYQFNEINCANPLPRAIFPRYVRVWH